jgi:hypothetical protein
VEAIGMMRLETRRGTAMTYWHLITFVAIGLVLWAVIAGLIWVLS